MTKTVETVLRSARMLASKVAGSTQLLPNTFSRQTMTSLFTLRRWRAALCLSCSYTSSGIFLIVKVAREDSPREDCRMEPEMEAQRKLTISNREGQGRVRGRTIDSLAILP